MIGEPIVRKYKTRLSTQDVYGTFCITRRETSEPSLLSYTDVLWTTFTHGTIYDSLVVPGTQQSPPPPVETDLRTPNRVRIQNRLPGKRESKT